MNGNIEEESVTNDPKTKLALNETRMDSSHDTEKEMDEVLKEINLIGQKAREYGIEIEEVGKSIKKLQPTSLEEAKEKPDEALSGNNRQKTDVERNATDEIKKLINQLYESDIEDQNIREFKCFLSRQTGEVNLDEEMKLEEIRKAVNQIENNFNFTDKKEKEIVDEIKQVLHQVEQMNAKLELLKVDDLIEKFKKEDEQLDEQININYDQTAEEDEVDNVNILDEDISSPSKELKKIELNTAITQLNALKAQIVLLIKQEWSRPKSETQVHNVEETETQNTDDDNINNSVLITEPLHVMKEKWNAKLKEKHDEVIKEMLNEINQASYEDPSPHDIDEKKDVLIAEEEPLDDEKSQCFYFPYLKPDSENSEKGEPDAPEIGNTDKSFESFDHLSDEDIGKEDILKVLMDTEGFSLSPKGDPFAKLEKSSVVSDSIPTPANNNFNITTETVQIESFEESSRQNSVCSEHIPTNNVTKAENNSISIENIPDNDKNANSSLVNNNDINSIVKNAAEETNCKNKTESTASGNGNVPDVLLPKPVPPLRKRRSPSVPALHHMDRDFDESSSKHITDILVTPPPRNKSKGKKKFQGSGSNIGISYSTSDITGLADEDITWKSRRLSSLACSHLSKDDSAINTTCSTHRCTHDVSFSSPEISDIVYEDRFVDHYNPVHRASVCLLDTSLSDDDNDDDDDEMISTHNLPTKKTPHVKRKSYTFTKGDVYMQKMKGSVKLKKTKSFSNLIRRTFSLKDVRKSDNPPCMPNLFKRYKERKKRRKEKRKSKNLPTIEEEEEGKNMRHSSTTESFASIFLKEQTEPVPLNDPSILYDGINCSCASVAFPDPLRRSNSSIDVSQYASIDLNPDKPQRQRSMSSLTKLPRHKYLLKKIKGESSCASLDMDTLKRAKELLDKSLGSKNLDVPTPPKRSKSKLSLDSLSRVDLDEIGMDVIAFTPYKESKKILIRQNHIQSSEDAKSESKVPDSISIDARDQASVASKGTPNISHDSVCLKQQSSEVKNDKEDIKNQDTGEITSSEEITVHDSNRDFDSNGIVEQSSETEMKATKEPPTSAENISVKSKTLKETENKTSSIDPVYIHDSHVEHPEAIMQNFLRRYSHDIIALGNDTDEQENQLSRLTALYDDNLKYDSDEIEKIAYREILGAEDINVYRRGSLSSVNVEFKKEINSHPEPTADDDAESTQLNEDEDGELSSDSNSKTDSLPKNCEVFTFPYDKSISIRAQDFTVNKETLIKECLDGTFNLKLQSLARIYENDPENPKELVTKTLRRGSNSTDRLAKIYEQELLEHHENNFENEKQKTCPKSPKEIRNIAKKYEDDLLNYFEFKGKNLLKLAESEITRRRPSSFDLDVMEDFAFTHSGNLGVFADLNSENKDSTRAGCLKFGGLKKTKTVSIDDKRTFIESKDISDSESDYESHYDENDNFSKDGDDEELEHTSKEFSKDILTQASDLPTLEKENAKNDESSELENLRANYEEELLKNAKCLQDFYSSDSEHVSDSQHSNFQQLSELSKGYENCQETPGICLEATYSKTDNKQKEIVSDKQIKTLATKYEQDLSCIGDDNAEQLVQIAADQYEKEMSNYMQQPQSDHDLSIEQLGQKYEEELLSHIRTLAIESSSHNVKVKKIIPGCENRLKNIHKYSYLNMKTNAIGLIEGASTLSRTYSQDHGDRLYYGPSLSKALTIDCPEGQVSASAYSSLSESSESIGSINFENGGFDHSQHCFVFQPLTLTKLAANVYYRDKKLEMFSSVMNTSQSINEFMYSELKLVKNWKSLDSLDKCSENMNFTSVPNSPEVRRPYCGTRKPLRLRPSLHHLHLANRNFYLNKKNLKLDIYPSQMNFLNENGDRLRTTPASKDHQHSPMLKNRKVYHYPFRDEKGKENSYDSENGDYIFNENERKTFALEFSKSRQSSYEENIDKVVSKVVQSPLTSRKFIISSVPNDSSPTKSPVLHPLQSLSGRKPNSLSRLALQRSFAFDDSPGQSFESIDESVFENDETDEEISYPKSNNSEKSSVQFNKDDETVTQKYPESCHENDAVLKPEEGSSMQDEPGEKTELPENRSTKLTNSSNTTIKDQSFEPSNSQSGDSEHDLVQLMNGLTNTIKLNCSINCQCGKHSTEVDGEMVKILAIQEKSGHNPEVIFRTWSERQDHPNESTNPSPIILPKWIESCEKSHRCLSKSNKDTPSPGPPSDNSKDCCSRPPENSCLQESEQALKKDEDQTQKDRCVEVYPETLRQRQRNMAPSPSKVDIKNWEPSTVTNEEGKKFLPSVKALRNQFENGKAAKPTSNTLTRSSSSNSSSTNSLVMSSLENSSGFGSLNSSQVTIEQTAAPVTTPKTEEEESVEPIFSQFKEVDEELKQMMSKPPSTQGWNPQSLLKRLYYIPDAPKIHRRETPCVNIEGYLEKLPSGRKKATFWNAWKRRYFVAKDGILYYYQNNQSEKPNMKLPLMGGKIEIMDPTMVTVDDGGREARSAGMLGIDDGKGHYVVVRCPSRQEAERWKKALETHTLDDFSGQYVQPWPRPTNPTLLRDTLVIDIGSCSVRAGVLASQPTLPQIFFPSVVATHRESKKQIWGIEALMPEVRSNSSLAFPVRPSHKISKFSVDLNAVSSLLQKTFNDLKVDPKNYNIQLSVPRVLNPHTQTELLKILFDKFGVKAVNLTHQSILALYAYNTTSGIIVDIGERLDVVPVIDGYIVDGGVSRVPYGGYRIIDHIRQFLFQKNISLANEVESYCLRQVLETVCYCAKHYNTEKQRCTMNPETFEKSVPLAEYFPENSQYDIFKNISLDFARFQATEGLFNPDAWGLDHPGLHKLVHKAIQECSMDIRKEMSRSIFLAGGVSQLPGVADRLSLELDNLTPPAVRPVVHASPYRYHAAYLGACVLAESDGFAQSKITKDEWIKQGSSALRKWAL